MTNAFRRVRTHLRACRPCLAPSPFGPNRYGKPKMLAPPHPRHDDVAPVVPDVDRVESAPPTTRSPRALGRFVVDVAVVVAAIVAMRVLDRTMLGLRVDGREAA